MASYGYSFKKTQNAKLINNIPTTIEYFLKSPQFK